jgi:hypothetical protein
VVDLTDVDSTVILIIIEDKSLKVKKESRKNSAIHPKMITPISVELNPNINPLHTCISGVQ